jgi:MinD-like ATPase involved in chromosome partitioning or flagellar assembly
MSHVPVANPESPVARPEVRVVVVGLPELGHLLAEGARGFTVAAVEPDSDARHEIARRVRGSSRAGLFFVLAAARDGAGAAEGVTGELARRLPAARFRTLVLAGLDGPVTADERDDPYLVRLDAPFTANDVLAALARLPDAPPFAPIPGGDRRFGPVPPDDGLDELDEILGLAPGAGPGEGAGLRVVGDEPGAGPGGGLEEGGVPLALPRWATATPPGPGPGGDVPGLRRPAWADPDDPLGRPRVVELEPPSPLAAPPVLAGTPLPAPPPARARAGRGRVLCICSYKGGSGKTTTALLAAATLGRAAAETGRRVALVDANTAQSSISTVLQHRAPSTILNLVRTGVDEAQVARVLTHVPEAALDILYGAPDLRSADGKLITPVLYRRVVSVLRASYDYVIVDTPVAEAIDKHLFDDFVLPEASNLVVVVDPNRETIENNLDWLDIISDPMLAGGRDFPAERIGVLLNRATPDQDWNAATVSDQFRRWQFLGAVPSSGTVQRAANNGRLLSEVDPEVDRALRGALHLLTGDPDLAPSAARPAGPGRVRALLGRRLLGRH